MNSMNPSTAEIKNNLHKLIVETDNESILSRVEAYFTTLKSKDADWWDEVTEHELDAIKTGLQQLKHGKRKSHNDVKRKADELLGRI